MEHLEEASKPKLLDNSTKLDTEFFSKTISSFVGNEKEFKKLLESSEATFYRDDTVVVITPNTEISKIVSHGIHLSDMMKKIKKELDTLSDSIKDYGQKKIKDWNSNNNDNVASARIQSDDGNRTVMITVKNAYSIDSEKLLDIKKLLGTKFEKAFTVNTSYSIKAEKAKNVISIIKNALGKAGAAFIKDSIVENTSVSINSRKDYEELINDPAVTDDIKKILIDAIKPQAPSITYPK